MFQETNFDFSAMKKIDADEMYFYCENKMGYNTVFWITNNTTCSLTSNVSEKDLIKYASNIFRI